MMSDSVADCLRSDNNTDVYFLLSDTLLYFNGFGRRDWPGTT